AHASLVPLPVVPSALCVVPSSALCRPEFFSLSSREKSRDLHLAHTPILRLHPREPIAYTVRRRYKRPPTPPQGTPARRPPVSPDAVGSIGSCSRRRRQTRMPPSPVR